MPKKEEIEELKLMCKDLSVLMVEDDKNVAHSYQAIAERFFKSVTLVYDAFAGIAEHEPGKFDIIYTDINMPGMNGVEMIRDIKNYDTQQKFIVMSASDDSDNLLSLLRLNVTSFVLKPLYLDNFMTITRAEASIIMQDKFMAHRTEQLQEELQEVTKEKEEQEGMLIQQTKLAETGEMISMIAHQWRQPLSSMTAQIGTLKTRLELGLYDTAENPFAALASDLNEMFDKIETSAAYLSKTINDFRNFYRPDNEVITFDVREAIEAVLNMLIMNDSPLEIETDFCEQCDTLITTYEGELQQVFMSIINNAKDAFEEQRIKEPKLKISIMPDNNHMIISFTDNAGGIPDNIVESIFLPYFSTKSKKNGTGLGLHMVKTIIERHMNGTINVHHNAAYGGASFTITIPSTKG